MSVNERNAQTLASVLKTQQELLRDYEGRLKQQANAISTLQDQQRQMQQELILLRLSNTNSGPTT